MEKSYFQTKILVSQLIKIGDEYETKKVEKSCNKRRVC